jgi:hypothetical protein
MVVNPSMRYRIPTVSGMTVLIAGGWQLVTSDVVTVLTQRDIGAMSMVTVSEKVPVSRVTDMRRDVR